MIRSLVRSLGGGWFDHKQEEEEKKKFERPDFRLGPRETRKEGVEEEDGIETTGPISLCHLLDRYFRRDKHISPEFRDIVETSSPHGFQRIQP